MEHLKDSEEEFDKDTQILEEIAEEAERGREGQQSVESVIFEEQHMLEPLKGPHHTAVKE